MTVRRTGLSVQPPWCHNLPLQQQSVLFLAARGPDGIAKVHPCKPVVVAYRATVFLAAKHGRSLEWGERGDTFMCLHRFADSYQWECDVDQFFDHHDSLPKHYLAHLMHGAEILGYKHPDQRFRDRWLGFYRDICDSLHLVAESEVEMDERLNDWGQEHWG